MFFENIFFEDRKFSIFKIFKNHKIFKNVIFVLRSKNATFFHVLKSFSCFCLKKSCSFVTARPVQEMRFLLIKKPPSYYLPSDLDVRPKKKHKKYLKKQETKTKKGAYFVL